mgnify:CR=1 FL=1
MISVFANKVLADTSDIHSVCKLDHVNCLQLLPDEYKHTKPKSFTWYQFKLYEIEAYFQLKTVKERIDLITPLLAIEKAPVNFKISVYIDYAKSMFAQKKYDLAREYAYKASDLIDISVSAFDSPMKLVQLTNLRMYLIKTYHELGVIKDKQAEYQESYDFLSQVLQRYKRSTDALFLAEVHANLGHLKTHTKENKQALVHYKSTIPWLKQLGNKQQLGVGFYNVARSLHRNNDLLSAKHFFRRAAAEFKTSNDHPKYILSLFQIINIHILLDDFEKARELFENIETNTLPQQNINQYEKTKQQLFGS